MIRSDQMLLLPNAEESYIDSCKMTYIIIDCRGWRADVSVRKAFLCPDKSLAKCNGIREREERKGNVRRDERSHMPKQNDNQKKDTTDQQTNIHTHKGETAGKTCVDKKKRYKKRRTCTKLS